MTYESGFAGDGADCVSEQCWHRPPRPHHVAAQGGGERYQHLSLPLIKNLDHHHIVLSTSSSSNMFNFSLFLWFWAASQHLAVARRFSQTTFMLKSTLTMDTPTPQAWPTTLQKEMVSTTWDPSWVPTMNSILFIMDCHMLDTREVCHIQENLNQTLR